jgi:hypothetical protein
MYVDRHLFWPYVLSCFLEWIFTYLGVCVAVYALLSLWTDLPVNRSCLCFRRRQNTVLILHRPACDEAMNNSDGMQEEQPFRVLIILPRFHNFCCDNSVPMVMCCGGIGGNNLNGCTSPAGRVGRRVALGTQVFAPFGLCWRQWSRRVSFPFLGGTVEVCWIGAMATSLTLSLCWEHCVWRHDIDKLLPATLLLGAWCVDKESPSEPSIFGDVRRRLRRGLAA